MKFTFALLCELWYMIHHMFHTLFPYNGAVTLLVNKNTWMNQRYACIFYFTRPQVGHVCIFHSRVQELETKMGRDKQGTFIETNQNSKHKKSGYQPYLAYLPLVPVRGAATSEGWHCSGFPAKASLNSCRDSVDSALLWPSRLSFVLKQDSARTDYFNCSKTRRRINYFYL
jgi:hypothetical protein